MDSWIDELMAGWVNAFMNVLLCGVVDGWTRGLMRLMNGWMD